MSKRRINQQQSSRIAKNQKTYQTANRDNELEKGLIVKCFGREALIESESGNLVRGSIRPSINSLVAGDRVLWLSEGKSKGAIVSRFDRVSVLMRKDRSHHLKAVAANISQMMVVIAPKPDVSWILLDSYLVMAEYLKLKACIVLNKTDLPHEATSNRLKKEYEELGYPILSTNQSDLLSFNQLKIQLADETSVFIGQSGVGKSSLIGRLLGQTQDIPTMGLSVLSQLGRHTTSNSCFYHLAEGGAIIDSPGIRELVLWHLPPSIIAAGYREFKSYIQACKYRNCSHIQDEGCALKAAVTHAKVSEHRYANYIKLSSSIER